jgi:hypothetical protein
MSTPHLTPLPRPRAQLLVHLWPQKAPRLQRIGLEGNRISAQAKRSIDPLPAFFSF